MVSLVNIILFFIGIYVASLKFDYEKKKNLLFDNVLEYKKNINELLLKIKIISNPMSASYDKWDEQIKKEVFNFIEINSKISSNLNLIKYIIDEIKLSKNFFLYLSNEIFKNFKIYKYFKKNKNKVIVNNVKYIENINFLDELIFQYLKNFNIIQVDLKNEEKCLNHINATFKNENEKKFYYNNKNFINLQIGEIHKKSYIFTEKGFNPITEKITKIENNNMLIENLIEISKIIRDDFLTYEKDIYDIKKNIDDLIEYINEDILSKFKNIEKEINKDLMEIENYYFSK